MKSFKKYNAQSRREFLTRGEYNTWEKGRHIIKEGYPALALYFILDGEVAVSKMKEKTMTDFAVFSKGQESLETTHQYKGWDGNNQLRLTTLNSGDSFGEVAFTTAKNHTRQATVTTLRKTEFLLVEVRL
jgi:CRP-like cAMP-binding protein